MNELFSQGGKGSTGILTNKQAVARHFGVKQSEVVYFSVGAVLRDYKVIYDKASQRAYSLPANIGSGVTAVSLSTAGVLVHSAGSVDLGALAVTREEYVTLPGSFDTGVTVNTKNELVVFTDGKYRWDGVLPKEVPADSTPETSGGVGLGAWVSVGDAHLRKELFSKYILYKTPQSFGAKGDGVADDTLPLQNAMDYCQINNQKLVIPSGKYLITKPLLYKNRGFYNYEIEGQGGNVEIILTTEAKTGITEPDAFGINVNVNAAMVVLTDTNQSKFCRISGIRFRTTVNAAYGIYLSITENSYIHDCFFEGFKFGIFDKGSWIQRIARCIARNCTDTGFYIEGGTSTYIKECYVDYAERGYYLASGYSSIIDCACDHTARWSYVFGGGSGDNATTDTRSISMHNCGSENTGRGSAIYIDGRVALGISNYHAGNYPPYQTTNTPYLVDVSSKGSDSQITMSNVRCVNFSYLINDASSSNNYFDLTNVTSRGALTGKYSLATGTRVLERTKEGGIRIITKTDLTGIGIVAGDIVDSLSGNTTLSGLRNGQFIYRKGISITRSSGTAGSIAITLPINLKNYRVAVTFNGGIAALQSIAPVFSVSDQTPSGFTVNCASSRGSESWTTLGADIIVYGVKE